MPARDTLICVQHRIVGFVDALIERIGHGRTAKQTGNQDKRDFHHADGLKEATV
jgi:hypothetical protein